MAAWEELSATTTTVLELVLRDTVTFLVLIVALRIVGQRESGGLGLTDLSVVVLVADAAGVGLQGGRGEAESISDSFVLVVTILFRSVAVDAVVLPVAAVRGPGQGEAEVADPHRRTRSPGHAPGVHDP